MATAAVKRDQGTELNNDGAFSLGLPALTRDEGGFPLRETGLIHIFLALD